MSERTGIAWCDSTLNFWIGCTKVSDGCKNCYAEKRDARFVKKGLPRIAPHWGKGKERIKSKSAVKDALSFNRKPWICDECGFASNHHDTNICGNAGKLEDETPFHCMCRTQHRRRIFSLSLGDWLDDEVPIEWLAEMLDTIRRCSDVDWILCTKRPENFGERLDKVWAWYGEHPIRDWVNNWRQGNAPRNIILLTSVENQAMADLRIPQLLKIPAARHGLSLEPLLGAVNLNCIDGKEDGCWTAAHLDWLIIGGESGNGARPCNVDWIRSLVEQGKAAGVATFVKQLGARPVQNMLQVGTSEPGKEVSLGLTRIILDKKGGDINEWPEDLRIQEFYSPSTRSVL